MSELVHTSLLIANLLRDLWDAIFIVYLSFQRYNGSTSFQLRIQWFSNVAAYATWHVSNLCLLLCCAFIALDSSALMLWDPVAMKMDIVREVQLWDAVSSQLRATPQSYFIKTWSCSFGPAISWYILEVCLNKLWKILDMKSCHIYKLRGKLILCISYGFSRWPGKMHKVYKWLLSQNH